MMRRVSFTSPLWLALAASSSVSCSPKGATSPTDVAGGTRAGSDERTTPAFADEVLASMDRAADPCQDFFRYACGGWVDKNEIPPDQSRWGRFNVLRERNREVLRDVLESEPVDGPRGKAVTFYKTCMNETAVEQAGTRPIEPILATIDAVKDAKSLGPVLGGLHEKRVGALFGLFASADYKDPDLDIAHVFQGGLGLPDRDYYIKEDERFSQIRAAYETHIAKMLELVGESPDSAAKHAKEVIAFETALATASMPRDQLRDPEKRYHKIDRKGLVKAAPQIQWDAYFSATGHPDVQHINVAPPAYFTAMGKLLKKSKPDTLRAYLRFHVVRAAASLHLPKSFAEADFEFYGKMLRGQKELEPRWKRCVDATDVVLGEMLGAAFVDRKFAGSSKKVAIDMIQRIEAAFESGLPSLSWMDEGTRTRAVEKMKAVVNKIGYPDDWRDYSDLNVGSDHFANLVAGAQFDFHRRMANVGKPVDEKEWHMTPPTVNAYYNATNNEMVFPAGIMQPPFFHADYPMAMNFGGIGMVMGHELTHGFDDQGRKFDGAGRLTEWWDPGVSTKFEARAACVEQLYSSYEVQPGVHLNGKLTLGENIADLGGVKEAHSAYTRWVTENGQEPAAVDGLTNDQLFFVSFAQIWCGKETPEAERVLTMTDSHSRPRFRVNGPLANFPGFWAAFSCQEGTPMRPKNACEVW